MFGRMDSYDLIVCGGGPAGIGAALSASKLGLRVAIIEKSSLLGGNWTNGYVLSILGIYTYSGKTKIVGGIADYIVDELKRAGATKGKVGNFVPFRPDEMKLMLERICKENKIDIYLDSLVVGADVENRLIRDIYVSSKMGNKKLSARVFVDSTGDADLAAAAGNALLSGKEENGEHQQATIPFRIANVDEEKVIKYAKEHPDEISIVLSEEGKLSRIRILEKIVAPAKNAGLLYMPFGNSIFLFNTSKEGEYVCNASHSNVLNYKDGKELELSINEAREQVYSISNYLKSIPGFESSYLIDSSPNIGLRETRRAVGDYILKKSDVVSNARFEDKIVRCGHPIEVHDPEKGVYYEHLLGGDDSWYEIPYRAIVAKELDNLFIIGRCLSAEFEAQASARVTGTAMGMGQAAATAAYLMISKNLKSAREVDIKELQSLLLKNGAII